MAVIIAAFVIGLVVAKLVDMFYDRQAIRDDASDISDYTKELLKIQFMMAFNKKKKDGKESPEDIARRMVKLWRIGVVKKKRMRKIEAKRALEAAQGKHGGKEPTKDKNNANKDKDNIKKGATGGGMQLLSVKALDDPPAKVNNVNEKAPPANKSQPKPTGNGSYSLGLKPPGKAVPVSEKPPSATDASDNEKSQAKPPVNNSSSKAPGSKEEPSLKSQFKPGFAPIVCSDPADKPEVETLKNGVKPSLTNKDSNNQHHRDFVEFRADSDDLMIPVSTDEDPKPTLHVTSGRRASGSSKSDYEFLKDPEHDSVRTVDSGRGPDIPLTKTPSSLSAVKLESKDKAKDNTPHPTRPASRPETSKARAGPVSARPKSSAPPLITPTGRRPVSGKIVTPQGVKVVSRPKTPAGPKKF